MYRRVRRGLPLFLFACSWLSYADQGDDTRTRNSRYVGTQTCVACHQQQAAQWQDSHHAKAMQSADAKSVLGDFDNAEFRKDGFVSRFFRRDGKYFVHTDGHAGKPADYEIRYTFGVYPLQQYLIEIPGGKLQALGIAWDSRPKEQGGQRWYHLYPNQKLKAGDPLHWSGRDQNWNFMCAACHTTGLQKNFNLATNSYQSTWVENNVACESCHGAGAAHVANPTKDNIVGLGKSCPECVVEGICTSCHTAKWRPWAATVIVNHSFSLATDFRAGIPR